MTTSVDSPSDDLLFDRKLQTKVRQLGDQLEITATVVDDTLSKGGFQRVHDMTLVIRVRRSDREILHIDAQMDANPHPQCPMVSATMQRLVGLKLARGFRQKVLELVGGTRGCNHLATLALQAGTVASLSFAAELIADDPTVNSPDYDEFFERVYERYPAVENSCQVWASDGALVERLTGADPTATLEQQRASNTPVR